MHRILQTYRNRTSYMAYNLNSRNEVKGLLNIIWLGTHVYGKNRVQYRELVIGYIDD